jgi:hypothetical protein
MMKVLVLPFIDLGACFVFCFFDKRQHQNAGIEGSLGRCLVSGLPLGGSIFDNNLGKWQGKKSCCLVWGVCLKSPLSPSDMGDHPYLTSPTFPIKRKTAS